MYNYHMHEKKKKEEESRSKIAQSKAKYEESRKSKKFINIKLGNLSELANNYEKRVKNFIYKMVDQPVTIKDYNNIVSTTRKEFMEEEKDKIIGKKGFVFTSYKTEKQRLEEHIKNQNTIYAKTNTNQLDNYNDYNKKNQFVQPNMRYKARTDLERIFETINRYNYGTVDKEIVENQLRSLELINSKQVPLKTNNSHDEATEEEIEFDDTKMEFSHRGSKWETDKDSNISNKYKYKDKSAVSTKYDTNSKKRKIRIAKRKYVDNSCAKKVLGELHNKTHFKAATGFTLFNNRTLLDFKSDRTSRISDLPIITTIEEDVGHNAHHNTIHCHTENNRYREGYADSTGDDSEGNTYNLNKSQFKNKKRTKFSKPNNQDNLFLREKFTSLTERNYENSSQIVSEQVDQKPLVKSLNFNPTKRAKLAEEQENFDQSKLEAVRRLAFQANDQFKMNRFNSNNNISSHSTSRSLARVSINKANNKSGSICIEESTMTQNPAYFFQKLSENPKLVEDIMSKDTTPQGKLRNP